MIVYHILFQHSISRKYRNRNDTNIDESKVLSNERLIFSILLASSNTEKKWLEKVRGICERFKLPEWTAIPLINSMKTWLSRHLITAPEIIARYDFRLYKVTGRLKYHVLLTTHFILHIEMKWKDQRIFICWKIVEQNEGNLIPVVPKIKQGNCNSHLEALRWMPMEGYIYDSTVEYKVPWHLCFLSSVAPVTTPIFLFYSLYKSSSFAL